MRGYVYPLLLLPSHLIEILTANKINNIIAYRVYSSLVYALAFAYVIPGMFEKIFKKSIGITARLGVLIITMFFWPGLFIYALSDMVAVVFSVLSIFLLLFLLDKDDLTWKIVTLGLCFGISVYFTYNIRTVYIFTLPVLFLAFVINISKRKPLFYFVILVSIISGLVLAAIPQMLINQNNYGRITPLVITDDYAGHKNLFLFQLVTGITYERYETYVGPYLGTAGYPASMVYSSNIGAAILKMTPVKGDEGITEYLRLVIRYPLDFANIYFRHVISGLDNRFGMIYIKDITQMNNFTAFLNFTLWFFGLCFIKFFYSLKSDDDFKGIKNYWNFIKDRGIWLFALVMPVIVIIPGALETRFFLPLHILLYALLFYVIPWKEAFVKIKTNFYEYLFLYIIFLIMMFSVSGSILINLISSPQLLSYKMNCTEFFLQEGIF